MTLPGAPVRSILRPRAKDCALKGPGDPQIPKIPSRTLLFAGHNCRRGPRHPRLEAPDVRCTPRPASQTYPATGTLGESPDGPSQLSTHLRRASRTRPQTHLRLPDNVSGPEIVNLGHLKKTMSGSETSSSNLIYHCTFVWGVGNCENAPFYEWDVLKFDTAFKPRWLQTSSCRMPWIRSGNNR